MPSLSSSSSSPPPPPALPVHLNGNGKHNHHPSYREVDQVYTKTGQWAESSTAEDRDHAHPHARLAAAAHGVLFSAFNRSIPGRPDAEAFTWLELHDDDLVDVLRARFPNLSTLYERTAGIDCRDVYVNRQELRGIVEERRAAATSSTREVSSKLEELLSYSERKFAYVQRKLNTFPPGTTSWNLLWYLFRVGDDVETIQDHSGEAMAVKVDSWAYVSESMGRAFLLKCHYYQWAGTSFHKIKINRKIMEFGDLQAVQTLHVKPLTAEHKALLQGYIGRYAPFYQCGRDSMHQLTPLFESKHVLSSHLQYDGFFFTRAFAGASRLFGTGQVIIDAKGFRRCNPALDHWSDDVGRSERQDTYMPPSAMVTLPVDSLTDDLSYLLPPTLHGFSLRAKRWGEFLVVALTEIVWRENVFDHLVISDSYRRIVRSLVTVHSSSLKDQIMTDVVEGKGNGLIMCMHGKPGTGKTLTAEAIAAHLKRPLYMVSTGELGLTPANLERQLREVLELAASWNAVLLIDEADVFLEKRSTHHLERNALVAIFLRLLEYFSGVLILTTNNIESFDEAFLSRFAVCLKFDELSVESRRILWTRFLTLAGLDPSTFDLDQLASYVLNGRDIKHTIQTAQAVALVEQETLSQAQLLEVLHIAKSVR